MPTAIPELGVEGLIELEVRLLHRAELLAIRAEDPGPVLRDRSAAVDIVVVVAVHLVAVRANRRVVERVGQGVVDRDVRRLQRVVVPIDVILTLESIAAGTRDELALHPGVGHFGGLAGRAEKRLVERRVIEIESGAAGAFGRVDALDQHADLPGLAVGRVAGLRAGAVAGHVDAAHHHRRCDREQRPHVAAVGQRLHLIHLEVLLHAGSAGVDDRRHAADRDAFPAAAASARIGVDLRRKPERDAMPSRFSVVNPSSSKVEAGRLPGGTAGNR